MADEGWFKRLRGSLGDRRVIPPDPPGHRSRVPDEEPDEVTPRSPDDESSAWSAFITYRNAKGEDSSRMITLRKISGQYGEPEIIGAHCHQRNAYRSFRIDRISEMACAETGELLDPFEQCLQLHHQGALKIDDLVLTRLMRVLVFMARCDGEFHSLERSALEDILGRYFRFFGGDDAAFECAIKEAPRLAPSSSDLIKALKWLSTASQGPEICRFALDSCGSLIDADGRHAREEIAWGIEVGDILKRIAYQ